MAEIKYQMPRGTQDIYGSDITLWQQFETIVKEQCRRYGYKEIRTPYFEHAEVFKGENDSSDMVNKEMYLFKDNGNRELSLRPEGTKGVIRAFVEHKMYGSADFPVKLFYFGPMFRYDRPQKGRYRQFNQFGIEAIGARSPMMDVEAIALGCAITKEIGIENVVVLINTLGDKQSRDQYRKALKEYFEPYLPQLCEDCQRRFQQNPLRILDCKADKDHPCMANAPKCRDYLTKESKAYFQKVIEGLDELKIPYQIEDRLVRGLDYYTNTVFEAVPLENGSQQATLFGGGQYDGLVQSFGGGDLCGVGFGMGVERMIALASEQNKLLPMENKSDIYVITLGDVNVYGAKITNMLREAGFSVEMDYLARSLKAQFKSADRQKAKAIVIVGEDEAKNQLAVVKNTLERTQNTVSLNELIQEVTTIVG